MKELTIVGGIYHESCVWPVWNQIYGSGGRAAAAVSTHVQSVILTSYARRQTADSFAVYAAAYGFRFEPVFTDQTISFDYIHSLSVPSIFPMPARIRQNPPISVLGEAVLRFGMMEGSAVVTATHCVFDPQSAFDPELFEKNGSKAEHLAIVANRGEVAAMTGVADAVDGARALLSVGAEVVVVKGGAAGALVVQESGVATVPAYQTQHVWTVGSGDVFAAVFAAQWAVHGMDAPRAALVASNAVAAYVESMALPSPTPENLILSSRKPVVATPGRVYIASPFFSLGQRWVVDESRRCLLELGMDVFSPVHDVGPGPAQQVAPSDLKALEQCDAVFAILDGNDTGTPFEVGYAKAKGIPVYAVAQSVSEEDLKMVVGSECRVFDDFVTALHHLVWRA